MAIRGIITHVHQDVGVFTLQHQLFLVRNWQKEWVSLKVLTIEEWTEDWEVWCFWHWWWYLGKTGRIKGRLHKAVVSKLLLLFSKGGKTFLYIKFVMRDGLKEEHLKNDKVLLAMSPNLLPCLFLCSFNWSLWSFLDLCTGFTLILHFLLGSFPHLYHTGTSAEVWGGGETDTRSQQLWPHQSWRW